ncbi:Asp-tRNA(Asn)/Glu-tRNA(Gln) amidotransferase subunit GatC [Patescibacteria group bacterium]|nr:Asp-tRNA(Asn)/Glu-tRNA(Gln) amidotransferase subunit GatC [Patescibacteria group bacterium]MBU1123486.1 Asp-tRNA(Asn)/Glu-tRNA(Gln) amidotransferase subunit GatC [Patescibacteria group bacterium]MBU1911454.1 Asp-tRNA(Asn)/Glu-tRNA(Gln) amidotransferase subunit GatC [Patescibacteria group bacterium]
MSLTPDEVRHIAKLARLNLSDKEVEKFAPQLSAIIDYIGQLSEVDTKNIEPTAQVTGLTNSFREDKVTEQLTNPDALLETSPLTKVEHQIETPSAHG